MFDSALSKESEGSGEIKLGGRKSIAAFNDGRRALSSQLLDELDRDLDGGRIGRRQATEMRRAQPRNRPHGDNGSGVDGGVPTCPDSLGRLGVRRTPPRSRIGSQRLCNVLLWGDGRRIY
jgi:hypothetical protein